MVKLRGGLRNGSTGRMKLICNKTEIELDGSERGDSGGEMNDCTNPPACPELETN